MPLSRQERLHQIVVRLEKAYGRPAFLSHDEPLLDQLLFLVLQDGAGRDAADRSLQSLRKEFVDWNEVRVSSIPEIRSAMRMSAADLAEQKARTVRSLLVKLFADKNKISLLFLNDMDEEKGMRYLTSLAGVQPWIAATVLVLARREPKIDLDPSLHRIARRALFHERVHTPRRVAEGFAELVPPKELPRVSHLLLHHAEAVCHVKAPDCPECRIGELCPSNRVGRRARAST
jgi:endonuclease III